MAKKRRKSALSRLLVGLMGFACALVLGLLVYGTMVYQLAGEPKGVRQAAAGGVLALAEGTLTGETSAQQAVGGALCTVVTRTYALADGTHARAITATPAAYMERLSAPGVKMQLITGFVVDDMDALYAVSGETGILAARDGETVYLIEASCGEQALYALGAGARRQAAE